MALNLGSREGQILLALTKGRFRKNGIGLQGVIRSLKSEISRFNEENPGLNLTFEEVASLVRKAAKDAFDEVDKEIEDETKKK